MITELSAAPWNPDHQLLYIGLKGKEIPKTDLPPSNLVLLLDVSGSMAQANKLPLLKSALKLLIKQLSGQDRLAIVVYAGAAGVVLPATPGDQKADMITSLENLGAGGSTAGGEGIELAYRIARQNFMPGGNNRVILATDGDFNIGLSSTSDLVQMIEKQRESGVNLTVLGFGSGNYKDSRMEELADKGNGNYAYIDNLLEAKKVLVTELGGTLFTIAKDVKIQVEFNPAQVKAYKLIGYENRLLKQEDFNNDQVDAGEVGAGHTVTALYEMIPANAEAELGSVDALKYQQIATREDVELSNELATIKLRYKNPREQNSQLINQTVMNQDKAIAMTSNNFKFSAAVAQFGLLLRDTEVREASAIAQILDLAQQSKGEDLNGYRADFIQLLRKTQLLMEVDELGDNK